MGKKLILVLKFCCISYAGIMAIDRYLYVITDFGRLYFCFFKKVLLKPVRMLSYILTKLFKST